MKDHYTILVAMFACLGTFLYVSSQLPSQNAFIT